MQFCGPTNFHWPFWDGLECWSTFPAMMWMARVCRRRKPQDEAVADGPPDRGRQLRVQSRFWPRPAEERPSDAGGEPGELPRLVAWYGR